MNLHKGRLFKWQNWLGLGLVLAFVFVALAAPLISPVDAKNPGPIKVVGKPRDFLPQPPSPEAPLGTLSGQVSIFHSLVWGTRPAMEFGLLVVGGTALLGILIGMISAYYGGFLNGLLMRVTDAFLAFPLIAGVVLIQQIIFITLTNAGVYFYNNPTGTGFGGGTTTVWLPDNFPPWYAWLNELDPVMFAFILFSWMPYARIINAMVQHIKPAEYIQAARALGAGSGRLMFRHLLPNAISPVIVLAARDVGGVVLLQATFTYIGFGGGSLWGNLLLSGRDWIITPGGWLTFWWTFLPTTLTLIVFGIAWNLLGDGLNDWLNPRSR